MSDTLNAIVGSFPDLPDRQDPFRERVKEIYSTRDRFAHLDRVLRECETSDDPLYRAAAALWEVISGPANVKDMDRIPERKPMTTTQDSNGAALAPSTVRNFSQAAYLVVAPSPAPGGLPVIEDMKMTHGEADKRAESLERAYGKESYPCGLIVVPCKVLFDIPNPDATPQEVIGEFNKGDAG